LAKFFSIIPCILKFNFYIFTWASGCGIDVNLIGLAQMQLEHPIGTEIPVIHQHFGRIHNGHREWTAFKEQNKEIEKISKLIKLIKLLD
jgi:hypothetical protein